MSWTDLLRSSIVAFCQEIEQIRGPDDVLREQLNIVKDRTRRRLDSFVLHPRFDDVPNLQEELLENGRHIRELELTHRASRAQRLQIYDEEMEELAGRMLREQFNILGLEKVRRLLPGLSVTLSQDEDDSILVRHDDGQLSASSCQLNTAAIVDGHVQVPDPEVGWDDESCQTARPVRTRGQAEPHGNSSRDRIYRAMTKRRSLRQKTARHHRENSPSPPPNDDVQALHQHKDGEKALIQKKGHALCNKAIKLGTDGHTTCILVFKNSDDDEWTSAGHIPEGQPIPRLDSIIAEHVGHRQETGADSPSIKAENSSPIREACGIQNMIVYDGIGRAN
ncbi:hypothetical protein BFJ63_vAg16045 [Fusarium oxysporum f. sp. narcissi]|uniref:Uncharacterized protein n=1 Tax=Fusarium oxysporum f. sp. narcissi TaxID=451672 RepID=A0A4Q2V444_FUSOX|nr:hypothetical protein BFJ63_vAg16045 [Fusarium oxysporum f. sp. narcissi]